MIIYRDMILGRSLTGMDVHYLSPSEKNGNSSDEELDERLRKLVAVWKGCKPEEVDLSPENTIALAEELKAELSQSRVRYAKD